MRNRFGGACYRCGAYVAPGEGHFERYRKGWRTQHASCAMKYRGTDQNAFKRTPQNEGGQDVR